MKARMRVLVVDDNPELRQAICTLLDVSGYVVRAAANGLEALQDIERVCPDVVLLDMQMPVLDGRGLVQMLDERCISVRIVVMSGSAEGEEWAREISADGYIPKPFTTTVLLDHLDQIGRRPTATTEATGS